MAGRYCEGKIKMASEKVSRKMVLEIKYVNANNAVMHTENSKLVLDLVSGILAKISLGTAIWAKFRLGTGIWYPPSRPSSGVEVRRWTRNPLAWLRSTPEDSQPFTSLMVSQSACLYLRDFWICLVEPVFHIPWDFFSFLHTFFKNEDFSVKVFHLYYSHF